MATNQLPDPESLPLFRYTDQSGNERELNDRDPNPRVITDYVFSSDKWQHLPAAKRTVDGIMAQSNSDDWRCIVCQRLGPGCLGPSCVASWMSKANDRLSEIEIRETGPMGLGVFAACGFSEGDIIEEYQGEVRKIPINPKSQTFTKPVKLSYEQRPFGTLHIQRLTLQYILDSSRRRSRRS